MNRPYSTRYSVDIRIDEVRLWNLARSATEITEAMDRPLDGSTTGLVAYYRFDQPGAASVPDASCTVGEAELVNGATAVE